MAITTLSNSGVYGQTSETQEVIERMSGRRTPTQLVQEYFGIRSDDMRNTKALHRLGVKHTERLAEMGVSKELFESMFEDVLDFNQTSYDNQQPETPESSTSSDNGAETKSSVSNTPKRAGRPKK